MDLPDASRDRARRAGALPNLRHGPRADDAQRGDARESRIARHESAILDRPRPVASRARAGNGRRDAGPAPRVRSPSIELAAIGSRNTGRIVVRLAVLRAGSAIARDPPSQYGPLDLDG